MNNKENILYLVIPCYNEEEVLQETAGRLKEIMLRMIENGRISPKSRILFVNDGSKDRTWEIITELHNQDSLYSGLKLSRNKGHQNALLAGLMTAKEHADVTISLDADLQDDIEVIEKFIDEYYQGCDIVYGVRSARKTDTAFKRMTAQGFYKIMSMLGVDIVYNHADYRLMSKRSIYELEKFKEVNLFLRGIVPLIGFKTGVVTYERNERFAGESKYPLKKMLSFAMDGITSFSVKPIRLISAFGAFICAVSVLMILYFVYLHFAGRTIHGWTSMVISVWAIGGLQLLAIGIIGEYIGKMYMETKERPKFIVETFLTDTKEHGKE